VARKDPEISRLLERLDLENRGWQIVDSWDADMCSVGICGRANERRLVYVSTCNVPPGHY